MTNAMQITENTTPAARKAAKRDATRRARRAAALAIREGREIARSGFKGYAD